MSYLKTHITSADRNLLFALKFWKRRKA